MEGREFKFFDFRAHQGLGVASLLLTSSIIFLIAVVIFTFVRNTSDSGLLGDFSEVKVLTTVAGVDGPAVMERGILTTTQQRCLRHDHFVSVEIPVDFVRLDEPGPRVQYLSSAPQSQMPGCNLASSVYTLPPIVTEGTWRLEGITRSNKTSELRFWSSQPFKVVTAENPR